MKKLILLAGLLITGFAQAQIVTITGNGDPIEEGETFTFTTRQPQATSELDLLVTNITDQDIYVKLRMNSITNNANGNQVQFCFGELCFFTVQVGSLVPNNTLQSKIEPGESNPPADHFWNNDEGDVVGQPVSYNMSFVLTDANGTILETLRTFNYVYAPTMGTNDFTSLESLGISVSNTVVKDMLKLNSSQKATVEFYSVSGQLVKSSSVAEGNQSIDLSGLSAAVYIAKFTTENNQSSSIRIVKN